MVEPWTGVNAVYVLCLVALFCYMPGMKIMEPSSFNNLNIVFLVFVAGCMAIGFVAGEVGANKWAVSSIIPFLKELPPTLGVFSSYLAGGHQLLLTLRGDRDLHPGAFGELRRQMGVNPLPLFYAFEYARSVLLPYEGVMFLYIFTTGCVTLNRHPHDDRPLHRRRGVHRGHRHPPLDVHRHHANPHGLLSAFLPPRMPPPPKSVAHPQPDGWMRQRLFVIALPVFLTPPAVPTFRQNTGQEAAMSDKDIIDMKGKRPSGRPTFLSSPRKALGKNQGQRKSAARAYAAPCACSTRWTIRPCRSRQKKW